MPAFSRQLLAHSIPWLDLPWPIDLAAAFGRAAPLNLEIGFGDGGFLAAQARARPDESFLGIEVSWRRVQKLFRRLDAHAMRNVRVLRADARLALARLLPAAAFREIVINHPDPWPKERHHERRLIQAGFLALLAESLETGGRLTVATDHAEYADWIAERLERQELLRSVFETTRVHELPGRDATRYERKARQLGIGNHFFVFEKVAGARRPRRSEEIHEMPNVTFTGDVPLDHLLDDFEPITFHDEEDGLDVVVNMLRAYRQTREPHWLVETIVREGELTQQIGLIVIGDDAGKVTVKTSAIGNPRATWGVKRAVWYMARLVCERAPRGEMKSSTVGPLEVAADG